MTKTMIPSDDQKQISHVVEMADSYRALTIKTAHDCEFAVEVLSKMKAECKTLETRRKEITKPIDDAKKSVMALFKPALDAYAGVEAVLKPKIAQFHREQEQKRRAEQAKAEEAARKAREKLEAKAEKAREKGKEELAISFEMDAMTTVSATPAPASKVAGVATRKTWKAEVLDVKAVCLAIANGDIPVSVLDFKQAELNRFAATWQDNKTFEGLRIYQDTNVAIR